MELIKAYHGADTSNQNSIIAIIKVKLTILKKRRLNPEKTNARSRKQKCDDRKAEMNENLEK